MQGLVGAAPGVVTGETDMFPSERSDMTNQVVGHALTFSSQGVEGGPKILRVPQDDGCDQEIEPEAR